MLKSFDFFRRIQTEQQLTSSTGGCFTILALITAAVLIFLSIQDYYHETFYTFLAIKNDDSEYLPMRIDITFNKMPCQSIALEFNDELQYVQTDLELKLKMFTIKQEGATEVPYERRPEKRKEEIEGLQEGLKNKHQCRIAGIVNVPKTPGTLVFSPSAQNGLIETANRQFSTQARMSYKLKELQFGLGNNTFDFPIAHKSPVVEAYIKELQGNVNSRELVQDLTEKTEKVNFYNHLKIIPVVFDTNSSLVEIGQKYRYSLRAGQARTNQFYQDVMFFTEIEPINIVYKREDASLYDLVVSILAIVGGTVATIGIVNSVSHAIFNIKK